MCGITGFVGFGGRPREAAARIANRMGAAIAHRGPNDEGVWLNTHTTPGKSNNSIAFAFRRLAILDLSQAGHQPMESACGRFMLAFNGEIYNHHTLRQSLKRTWRGTSDSETLVEAIAEWGVRATLKKCHGMFALAVWDRRDEVLFLARDRLGEKPLYYTTMHNPHNRMGNKKSNSSDSTCFAFASELKALRQHPDFISELNPTAIAQQLHYSYIPSPHTIYSNCHKLPPASILEVRPAKNTPHPTSAFSLKLHPYWSLAETITESIANPFTGDAHQATDALEELLLGVVKKQMLSDVPLGAFLSGGIDSSTITALMQANSTKAINSYSIGFHTADFNEAEYAKAVARHLGTNHTELYVTPKDALDIIPRIPDIYDEPFADASQLPTFLLTRMVRKNVTVALSGDGGDELFGGYQRYTSIAKWWRPINVLPPMARRGLAAALRTPPATLWRTLGGGMASMGDKRFAYFRRLPHLVQKLAEVLATKDPFEVYAQFVDIYPSHLTTNPDMKLVKATPHPRSDFFRHEVADIPRLTAIESMMAFDTARYLPDDLLVKTDRAAMAVSLETRMPFLDHGVVALAWRLPMAMRIRDGKGKWILRQVLARHVPPALTERPKMGFGVPIRDWLRGELRDWAEHLLSETALKKSGIVNPAPIRQIWNEHRRGQRDWEYPLWNALMFQAWLEKHG